MTIELSAPQPHIMQDEKMDDIAKEEYKQLFTLALQLEQRMLQVFMVSLVISVSLLTTVSGVLISDKLTTTDFNIVAYLAIAPNLITIPSFILILSHRIDLARLAGYQMVFYEYESNAGWACRLGQFREHIKSEAHEPIPLAYWSVLLISLFLFFWIVLKGGLAWHHITVVAILIGTLSKFHYSWSTIGQNTSSYVSIWESVKENEKK